MDLETYCFSMSKFLRKCNCSSPYLPVWIWPICKCVPTFPPKEIWYSCISRYGARWRKEQHLFGSGLCKEAKQSFARVLQGPLIQCSLMTPWKFRKSQKPLSYRNFSYIFLLEYLLFWKFVLPRQSTPMSKITNMQHLSFTNCITACQILGCAINENERSDFCPGFHIQKIVDKWDSLKFVHSVLCTRWSGCGLGPVNLPLALLISPEALAQGCIV